VLGLETKRDRMTLVVFRVARKVRVCGKVPRAITAGRRFYRKTRCFVQHQSNWIKTCTLQPRDIGKMSCKVCMQLEEAVAASVRPDPPSILLGLNEAAIRNRARQKEERQLKTKMDLEKHQRSFHKISDGAAS
jgi:hypothetical protein